MIQYLSGAGGKTDVREEIPDVGSTGLPNPLTPVLMGMSEVFLSDFERLVDVAEDLLKSKFKRIQLHITTPIHVGLSVDMAIDDDMRPVIRRGVLNVCPGD